ncbi:hypothetical protein NXS19_001979 [Fusarium pseudograminearum]|nr:hypothetical protein NXS19_001979 [Fusarium pseudograminearum]
MRLFMRQDSQKATQAANATAQAANATETQTLMRFMRRQASKAANATEAAINATSQAANVTAEAANATETQTLMRFMRRQESKAENATAAAVNATAQAVADVDQALNTTAQALNITQAQNSRRTEVYSDSKIEKVVEKAAEKAADKLINKLDKEESKSQSKRDAKFYNGYLPKCKGKIVKAYGIDGLHSGPLKDFSVKSHPNTCRDHQGDYVVYSHDELKKTVYGKLYESHGGDNKFGNYFIELVKGHDSYSKDIVVSIDISDKYQYEATEAKVFIGCDPGIDHHSSDNICSEKTYPYLAVAEKGLNEFVFAIPDKVHVPRVLHCHRR